MNQVVIILAKRGAKLLVSLVGNLACQNCNYLLFVLGLFLFLSQLCSLYCLYSWNFFSFLFGQILYDMEGCLIFLNFYLIERNQFVIKEKTFHE